MAYTQKIWTDRQTEFPTRRKLTATGTTNVYDVSREEGTIVTAGDQFNAANMNDLEARIAEAITAGSSVGASSTAAATAAKVVTVSTDFTRETGVRISVTFSYANTASSPTMNVAASGALPIYDARTNTYPVSGAMGAGTHDFVFNGTAWVLLNPIATSVATLATNRAINGAYFNGSSNITNYATSTSTYDTAAKVATCSSSFALVVGARVSIKFTYGNTATAITLNVNSTGAVFVAVDGAVNSYLNFASWAPGSTVDFVYDGTYWQAINISSDVYYCCGYVDDAAIAAIVNYFFNSGTAMAKNLTIRGTMGITASPTNNDQIGITATNSRGAVCTLDFSDCNIPTITTSNRNFFHSSSATARLNIVGLIVTTSRYAVNLESNYNSLRDCILTTSSFVLTIDGNNNVVNNCTFTTSVFALYLNGSNNSFSDCTFTAAGNYALDINDGSNNSFNNCNITSTAGYGLFLRETYSGTLTFKGCKIVGATIGIYALTAISTAVVKLTDCAIGSGGNNVSVHQNSSASTMKWNIKGCSFSYSSIFVNGAVVAAETNFTNIYVFIQAYANLFSQTIT